MRSGQKRCPEGCRRILQRPIGEQRRKFAVRAHEGTARRRVPGIGAKDQSGSIQRRRVPETSCGLWAGPGQALAHQSGRRAGGTRAAGGADRLEGVPEDRPGPIRSGYSSASHLDLNQVTFIYAERLAACHSASRRRLVCGERWSDPCHQTIRYSA